jgi:hypothetical protein
VLYYICSERGRGDLGKAYLLRDTNVLKRRDMLSCSDLVLWRTRFFAFPGLLCSPAAIYGNCSRLTNLLNAAAPLPRTCGGGALSLPPVRRAVPEDTRRQGHGPITDSDSHDALLQRDCQP